MSTDPRQAVYGHVWERQFLKMLGLSTALHGVVLALVSLVKWTGTPGPLLPFEDTIVVSLVATAPLGDGGQPGKSNTPPRKETFVPPPEPQSGDEPLFDPSREAKSIDDAMKPDPTPVRRGLDEEAKRRLERVLARQRLSARVAALTGTVGARDRKGSSSRGVGSGSGNGLSGSANSIDPVWAKALNDRFEQVWFVLPTLRSKNLVVQVNVEVDADGGIRTVAIKKSSGNKGFDEAAVRAVKKAAPLPLPTKEDLRRAILSEGFVLMFNPKGLAP